jgi:hypothetical protein
VNAVGELARGRAMLLSEEVLRRSRWAAGEGFASEVLEAVLSEQATG